MGTRESITYVPEGEQETITPDMDASEVALANLEAEISQTEGLAVTVHKVIGKPNDAMGYCFKQPASNFPTLDDLKEYVQRHYGAGDFRAFYRVGNRIKYNLPFSVSDDLVKSSPPATSLPQTTDPAIAQALKILGDQLAALNQKVNQPQVIQNPMQQIKDVMEVMGPFLPKPGAAPVAGGGMDVLSGLKQMQEIKALLLEDVPTPNVGERPWWADFAKELATGLAPVLGGLVAAARAKAQGAVPMRDVTPPAAQPTALPTGDKPVTATANDPAAVAREALGPYQSALQQLNQAAALGTPPETCAGSVLDQTPETGLIVLEQLSKPENRLTTYGVIVELVPAAEGKKEWWLNFLGAMFNDLQEEPLTVTDPPPTVN